MSVSSISPIGDRILIQRREEKDPVRGGIYIPDSAQETPQEATVIALGAGTRNEDGTIAPFEVKVGDIVLVGTYGGSDVTLDGSKYTLVREDDILGILAEGASSANA